MTTSTEDRDAIMVRGEKPKKPPVDDSSIVTSTAACNKWKLLVIALLFCVLFALIAGLFKITGVYKEEMEEEADMSIDSEAYGCSQDAVLLGPKNESTAHAMLWMAGCDSDSACRLCSKNMICACEYGEANIPLTEFSDLMSQEDLRRLLEESEADDAGPRQLRSQSSRFTFLYNTHDTGGKSLIGWRPVYTVPAGDEIQAVLDGRGYTFDENMGAVGYDDDRMCMVTRKKARRRPDGRVRIYNHQCISVDPAFGSYICTNGPDYGYRFKVAKTRVKEIGKQSDSSASIGSDATFWYVSAPPNSGGHMTIHFHNSGADCSLANP